MKLVLLFLFAIWCQLLPTRVIQDLVQSFPKEQFTNLLLLHLDTNLISHCLDATQFFQKSHSGFLQFYFPKTWLSNIIRHQITWTQPELRTPFLNLTYASFLFFPKVLLQYCLVSDCLIRNSLSSPRKTYAPILPSLLPKLMLWNLYIILKYRFQK